MSSIVVDSSVILAILKQEPGAEAEGHLDNALASTVNLAEVATKLIQLGYTDEQTDMVMSELGISSVPFTEDFIAQTARLTRRTKAYGLSFGDRACLALAIHKQLPVLTADRVWVKLDLPVEIQLVR